jgi:SAM-dependent methyltransferase
MATPDTSLQTFRCQACPADRKTQACFEIDGYRIVDCQTCGHRFVENPISAQHVADVYSDAYFTDGAAAGYVDYLSEGEMLRKRGQTYGEIINRHTQPGHMLDVGAAAGFLLKGFMDQGWQGQGVEPNGTMARYGNEQLGVKIAHSPVEAFRSEQPFDLVSMIQVIPHFWNLTEGLQVLSDLTKPGGYWLIETWNKDSKMAKLFGKSWHEYSPPSVLHWFTPDSLQSFARQYGFEKVAQGRPGKKIQAHHAKSLLSYKLEGSALATPARAMMRLIPDKLTIPYPAEDLFYMVLRKQ